MNNYLFEALESGEMFLVQADTLEEAKAVADEWWSDEPIEWTGEIWSDFEAECSGLDTY